MGGPMDFLSDLWDTVSSPFQMSYDIWQNNLTRGSNEHWNRVSEEQWNKQFKFNKNQAQRTFNMQNLYATMDRHQAIQNRVRDAKKAGLHPLAVLGGASSAGTPSYMPASGGSASFNRPASANQLNARFDGKMQRIQTQLLEEQLKQSMIVTKQMSEPQVSKQPDVQVAGKSGSTPGLHQAYKIIEHPDGGVTFTGREDGELEDKPSLWHDVEYPNMKAKFQSFIINSKLYPSYDTSAFQSLRKFVMDRIRTLNQNRPPGPGKQWTFNMDNSKFYKTKLTGKMFIQNTPWYQGGKSGYRAKKKRPG
ncbi:MAG: hypothetical protein [Microviridae sp.]|nr:MAG: hypothetical protein [Microviridae sp.]